MKYAALKVIDEYIESQQMSKYLKNNIAKLTKRQLIDIICGARADIKQKYASLQALAEFEKTADEGCLCTKAAEHAREILNSLILNKGEVFLNNECGFDCDVMGYRLYGAEPSFSVQKVKEYIIKEHREAVSNMTENEITDITYWYELEKYIPDENENLTSVMNYTIAPDAEIWFAGSYQNRYSRQFCSSADLNLPVPFDVGDIITIDCRPFVPVKHGVIIEKGDNVDSCCIQCAWITQKGYITVGALKHASVFDDRTFVKISPLYRAEIYSGELPDDELPLRAISDYLAGDEEKGSILWDFIVHCIDGVTYEELTKYMAEEI